ncbi:3-hydroxy-9,10-secoandrosta-1,3,5(10)-triene-9,17-dione monooxygenase oxygenase subunit [Streptomyces sp. NPDC059524]|uniref:3-hydroxy-9,10-secoandrosta-1,3,5(10)-triene-9, 17-dione monooxygenase oxygenase subunit n=1 Tax=Streptomyces sp. NPDC059524 TaxID=3346856 RepID=UPI003684866D
MTEDSTAAVLASVRALLPAVAERAAEAEELRRIPEATVKELASTGFFRLLQPRRYGGHGADPAVFYDCVKEIAQACGSTGWVASVLGVHPWHVALYEKAAQDEVWGENGERADTRISSSYAPTGTAARVDGGFRLSGRWHFSSGCDHAQWIILGALVPDADGNPVDMRAFLLPRTDYEIKDVWDTVGLRGTGSNDILVEDVFVPEHRALSYGPVTALAAPGLDINPEPVFRLPYAAVFTTTISSPIVGIAQGAWDGFVSATRERIRVSYGQKVAEDPFAQIRLARSASDIDAAWRQLRGNIGEMYDIVSAGGELSTELRARARRDQVLATERCAAAVDLLMENAGGNAMRTGAGPAGVQRAWRDIHTGRGHAANDPERALLMFGQDALGLDVQDVML